jgi:Cys-tRNA(Pro) deacylase
VSDDRAPAVSDPRLAAVEHRVVTHGRVRSLEEAAEARGLEPAAVIKTMVVRRDENDYLFVLVPGDRRIDWPKLRTHLDERRLSMPDPSEALAVTGYRPGTITPFGSTRDWPVIMDQRLTSGDVSIGAGRRGWSITIEGSNLREALSADIADVTRPA